MVSGLFPQHSLAEYIHCQRWQHTTERQTYYVRAQNLFAMCVSTLLTALLNEWVALGLTVDPQRYSMDGARAWILYDEARAASDADSASRVEFTLRSRTQCDRRTGEGSYRHILDLK
jgi:hypothetical protein